MSDANPKNKLVRSEQWQAVRKSLLGQWKERPEWCCAQLRRYLGKPLCKGIPSAITKSF